MFRMFSVTLVTARHNKRIYIDTFIKLFLKLRTALLIGPGPAEYCLISSPVRRLLIQKLFWSSNEVFTIVLSVAPQTCYLHDIQIWRVN